MTELFIRLALNTAAKPSLTASPSVGRHSWSSVSSLPIDLLDAFREHPYLVVLGPPGSGKTTFLQFIAHHLAGAALGTSTARDLLRPTGSDNSKIPVLLSFVNVRKALPRVSNIDDEVLPAAVEALVRAQFGDIPPGQLPNLFFSGRMVLLLDQLDELSAEADRIVVMDAVVKAVTSARYPFRLNGSPIVSIRRWAMPAAEKVSLPDRQKTTVR